jgi:hypothetical protein
MQVAPLLLRRSYKTDERNITHYTINDHRICYSYYGIYYAHSFQDEWALNHLPKTGPHECLDCLYYGTYKGIFTEYCVNCSKNEYPFQFIRFKEYFPSS